MLTPRAQKFLSTLKRLKPVSAATLERALNDQGAPCFPTWLDFQERYSGYVEPIGLDRAAWGIVHDHSSHWVQAGRADVERDTDTDLWIAMCADLHPTYSYFLDQNGEFLGRRAESFDIYVERCGLYMESYELGRREVPRKQIKDPSFAAQILETMKPYLVPEASDKYLRYYVNNESLLAENVQTKQLQLVMKLP